MAVRFVLGRAGTGKTHHCLEAIRARLRQSAVDGPRLVLLVPEQAALQMERLLIETPDVPAFARCEVLSFRRLAHRILQQAGDAGRAEVTANGRMMVLRHLLHQHEHELSAYRRVLHAPGFVRELAHGVVELLHEQVPVDKLHAAAAEVEGAAARAKLTDLSVLYAAYLEYLGGEAFDPAQALDQAAERLAESDWGTAAEIWVDGFAGFTAQETAMLVALAGRCAHLEIALLLDPEQARGAADDDALWREFAATERTLLRLTRLLNEAGVSIERPLDLPGGRPPRFAAKPALAALERHLLGQEPGPRLEPEAEPAIELFSFSNRRDEVAAALTRVQDLVRRDHDPLRYREIALIVRDLAPYHDLIAAEGAERGIPVFIDRRRPMTHHPLVELIRGLCAVAVHEFSLESVRVLLKSGLLPLSDDALDELENYVIAYGIEGRALWLEREWGWWGSGAQERPDDVSPGEQRALQRVNRTRQALLRAIDSWLVAAAGGARRSGREWAVALDQVLRELDVPRRLEEMAVAAEERGRPVTAQEHRQIWSEAVTLLEDFEGALGAMPMDVAELARALESGLAELTLGLAPPMLDQVLVGDIERSRHPPLRAVLLLGVNERQFPRVAQERPILTDDDRAALGRAGVPLPPIRAESLVQERYLGYVALTRAGEYLWLSYPAADEQGRELFASPLLEQVRRAVPGIAERRIDTGTGRAMVMIGSAAALAGRLALEMSERRAPREGDALRRAEWNLLYERSRADAALHPALRPALRALVHENSARLDAPAIELLARQPLRGSVTRLETFAACPFQHFSRYLLRLGEREEHTLEAVELGTVAHAVLEQYVAELMGTGRPLHETDPVQMSARLGELAGVVARELHDEMLLGEARNRYLIQRCTTDLERALRGQRAWSRATRLRPRAVEKPFGIAERDDSLPPLVITTPKGRRLEIRGVIDRVDVAEEAGELLAVVIDYKRTREKRLDLYRVHHGLALQLLTYLLVLREHGRTWLGRPITPIGAFYVRLRGAPRRVDHPGQVDAAVAEHGAEVTDAEPARGLLDFSRLDVIDARVAPGTRSRVVSAQRKKDTGGPGNVDKTDVAEAGPFRALLESVKETLARLGDDIYDGAIDISPYRLGTEVPCSYCAYKSVCRFDYQLNRVRTLRRMSRSEVMGLSQQPGPAAPAAAPAARKRKSKNDD